MSIIHSKGIADKRQQSGIAMIEVVVTMFVVAFGVMSLMTLQLSTLNSVNQSNQVYTATILVQDMLERVRAGGGKDAFNYDRIDTDTFTGDCSNLANCTAKDADVYLWKKAIEDHFPADAKGTVAVRNTVKGPIVTVTIDWGFRAFRQWQAEATDLDETSFSMEVLL